MSGARAGSAIFRAYLAVWSQFRVNVVIWASATLLSAVVSLSIWTAVARSRGGEFGGMDVAAFAGYFAVLLFVLELTGGSMMAHHLPFHIRSGELSALLVRPLHPLWHFTWHNLALKVQFAVIGIVSAAAVGSVFGARIDGSPVDVAIALLLLPLALCQVFLLEACVGCIGFFVIETRGVRGLYTVTRGLLGGMFAPLAVFPDGVRAVAELLPFWWAVGYPARLASGGVAAAGASPLRAAGMLAAWTIGSWLLFRVAWAAGIRRYGAVGA